MNAPTPTVHPRIKAFHYAISGLAALIRSQPHARFHVCATLMVIVAGWWFDIMRHEWVILALAVGLVWVAEAMNTAIEHLSDAITSDHHPLIGRAKDVAAAGVLVAAVTALIVGLFIFIPKVF